MDNAERRKNERLTIEMRAEIYLPEKGVKICGSTKNISFGGAFVLTDPKTSSIKKGEHVVLSIILQKKPAEIALRIWSQVVHVQEHGVGLNFIHIDIEAYKHFKEMMVLNSPEPEALIKELSQSPGLEIKKRPDQQ